MGLGFVRKRAATMRERFAVGVAVFAERSLTVATRVMRAFGQCLVARPSILPQPRGERRARGVARSRGVVAALAVLLLCVFAAPAWAQSEASPQNGRGGGDSSSQTLDPANLINVLNNASRAVPMNGGGGAAGGDAKGNANGGLSATLSIIMLLTVLSLAPAILVMTTSFTRIVIVLALLRQAIGTQGLPPSQVIVGLSLFMTFLVMSPTFQRMNNEALAPLQAGEINETEAWQCAKQPLRDFMFNQIDYANNWEDVYMVLNYQGVDTSQPEQLQRHDVGMLALVPAFILSELKVAFLMGFRLYLPFLVIDMVVASVLISMGMLMLPPVLISLPFKLLLFVLVDGWMLVAGNLLHSFSVPGVTT